MKNSNKKLGKIFKISAYVLSALLVLSYLFVMVLAPNVCIEYDLYYIKDELSDWPGYGGLTYESGTKVELSTALRLGYGWLENRENGVQSRDGSASIFFTLKNRYPLSAELEVGNIYCTKYSVLANGRELLTDVTENNTTLKFNIPTDVIPENGLLKIEILSKNETDETNSGIQVFSITLYENEAIK